LRSSLEADAHYAFHDLRRKVALLPNLFAEVAVYLVTTLPAAPARDPLA
jgi:hypothetical protein